MMQGQLAYALAGMGGSGSFGGTSTSPEGVRPPEGEIAIVFSDITRAASLWEFDPAAMRDATLAHNQVLRSLLKKHRGYEVVFIRFVVPFWLGTLRMVTLA